MKDDRYLAAFALGTFHAVIVTLLLVFGLYLTTDLGDTLAGLGTAIGLAVFAALWATSVYCTHRGLQDAGLTPSEAAPASTILSKGFAWGAWNGVTFFWCLLAGFLLGATLEGETTVDAVIASAILAGGIGTILSAALGAGVGVVLALFDLQVLHAARSLTALDGRGR